jgi:NAD(P)-dependent dehydrogenase (short-subunit alcohol dehydrogenase family)
MAMWTTRDIPDQSGRLAIVTGATGGLGLETAAALAGAGAEVLMAGRNPAKGRDAEAVVRGRRRGAKVGFELVDLASLTSVKGFADRVPTLMAAAMPGVKGGRYFGPQGWMELKGPPGPGKIEPRALDIGVAAKLWEESERLTGAVFG